MKTSELTGNLLDYWVVRADQLSGKEFYLEGDGSTWVRKGDGTVFRPSRDWAKGGPLIDAHDIRFHYPKTSFFDTTPDCYVAICGTGMGSEYPMRGATRLEAAMRALVASVFGGRVTVSASGRAQRTNNNEG